LTSGVVALRRQLCLGAGTTSYTGSGGEVYGKNPCGIPDTSARIIRLLVGLAMAAALGTPSLFGGEYLAASAEVNSFLGYSNGGGCSVQRYEGPPTTSSLTASVACGFTSEENYSGIGNAYATAEFDNLSAYTSQLVVLGAADPAGGGVVSNATAAYSDALQFIGPIIPSYVELTATIDGSGGPGGLFGQMYLQIGNAYCTSIIDSGDTSTSSCSVTAPVAPDGTVDFSQSLEAGINVDLSGVQGNTFTLVSDFSHTADISGIEFFDANMQPLTGIEFDSASGASYPSQAPEPGSMSLLTLAALSSIPIKRRCMRRQRS
jgi:hypothetical protein